MQGSIVRRQSGAEALVTEEPYALIAHVRVCGGAGWVTIGSTRHTLGGALSCGLVRPLPPTRFLLFDLNRVRQEQHFLTLGVIPIHLWRHHWQGRGSRFSLT